jgi:hypothetical protein
MRRKLYAPVDIEGHKGLDGRYYVVVRDFATLSLTSISLSSQLDLTCTPPAGLCPNVPARKTLSSQVQRHSTLNRYFILIVSLVHFFCDAV